MLSRCKPISLATVLLPSFCISGIVAAQQPPPATPPETPAAAEAAQPAAEAATPTAEEGAPKKGRRGEEEIVVTGSRVRRKDLTTPAPVTVLSREQLSTSSKISIGEFLQQIPENGGALNTQVNNGGDGQTRINLRNLGSQRTLVLVDGKRMVNGGVGVGTAVDLNSIPTAAVERVEILKDGGSAVYGSDAIGGVVNVITRKKVDGVEATAYAGTSQHGDASQYDLNLLAGASSSKGSFTVGAGYFVQQSFFAGARDWASNALSYDFNKGLEGLSGSGTVPNVRVNALDPSTCSTALCQNLLAAFGAGPKNLILDPHHTKTTPGTVYVTDPGTGLDWRLRDAVVDFYNYQSVNYLVTPQQRISLFGGGDYNVSDFARAYIQGSYVQRESNILVAPEPFTTLSANLTVSGSQQYNPFGTNLVSVQKRLTDLSGRGFAYDVNTYRIVAGVDGTLPDGAGVLRGWYWDVAVNYGRAAGTSTSSGFLNTQKTGPGLGPSAACTPPACTPINLFGDTGAITPDQAAQLGAYTGANYGTTQMFIAGGNFSGELFKLYSDRPASLAVGYEYRHEYGLFQNNPILAAGWDSDTGAPGPVDTRGGFYVNEGYGELVVPIISGAPGAENIEVQAATRIFDYSTFGSDLTYKFGARWSIIRELTLRGTYSTAFRAPNILELYQGQTGGNFESSNDPCAVADPALAARCDNAPGKAGGPGTGNHGLTVAQVNSINGGNPHLQAETANIATAGIVLEPAKILKGFTLTGDFYWISLDKQIGTYGTQLILNKCYGAAGVPQDINSCALVEREPISHGLIHVTDVNANVGKVVTRGIDLGMQYRIPSPPDYGRFFLWFTGTYLLTYDYVDPTGLTLHSAGNYDGQASVLASGSTNFNPRVKFNTGLNYNLGGFGASITTFFIGPLTECAPQGGVVAGSTTGPGFCYQHNKDPTTGLEYASHDVGSSWRFDLLLSYGFKTPVGSTTIAGGIRNVFDHHPPRLYDSFLTYADPAYDFVGRFFFGRLEQKF